jgi:hypothetical protein
MATYKTGKGKVCLKGYFGKLCRLQRLTEWLIMMGWDWRLRTGAITGLLFIPRVNVSGESWWWWCRLGITPGLSTRARWQSYQQRHLERVWGMDEGMKIYVFSIFDTSTDLLHAVNSYDMGPSALLPIRRNVCCGFLSSLKIHRLSRVWTRDPWVQWQAH